MAASSPRPADKPLNRWPEASRAPRATKSRHDDKHTFTHARASTRRAPQINRLDGPRDLVDAARISTRIDSAPRGNWRRSGERQAQTGSEGDRAGGKCEPHRF